MYSHQLRDQSYFAFSKREIHMITVRRKSLYRENTGTTKYEEAVTVKRYENEMKSEKSFLENQYNIRWRHRSDTKRLHLDMV